MHQETLIQREKWHLSPGGNFKNFKVLMHRDDNKQNCDNSKSAKLSKF